jgi:hypothetical protein
VVLKEVDVELVSIENTENTENTEVAHAAKFELYQNKIKGTNGNL